MKQRRALCAHDGSAIVLVMMVMAVILVCISNVWYATSLAVEIAHQRQMTYRQKNMMEAALMYASLWVQENTEELVRQYEEGIGTWQLAIDAWGSYHKKEDAYSTATTLTVHPQEVDIVAHLTFNGRVVRTGACQVRIEQQALIKGGNKQRFFAEKWRIE